MEDIVLEEFPISHPRYISRTCLNNALVKLIPPYVEKLENLNVLDIGCGSRPYSDLVFKNKEFNRIGVDLEAGQNVDAIAPAENLPFASESFNVALCIQVLEHTLEPERVVLEIARVLKPGGYVFLSTHGTFFYHPTPGDYWRWTHTGLKLLFDRSNFFQNIEVIPLMGTFSSLAMLNCYYFNLALDRVINKVATKIKFIPQSFKKLGTLAINSTGLSLDRWFPMNFNSPGSLHLVFLLIAQRNDREFENTP
jgi:ubiquinone/menaquinone biosynthesis C-methylase UbiE